LCKKQMYQSCRWLRRARESFAWIHSLVPIRALNAVPKRLDLKFCEIKSITEILQAHKEQSFSKLCLELNLDQHALVHLIESGYFDMVIELDLQDCPDLSWTVIEPRLVWLKKLEHIYLPSRLVLPAWDDFVSDRWGSTIKAEV